MILLENLSYQVQDSLRNRFVFLAFSKEQKPFAGLGSMGGIMVLVLSFLSLQIVRDRALIKCVVSKPEVLRREDELPGEKIVG